MAMHGTTIAQTSTPPTKSAQVSTSKSKHHTSVKATSKHGATRSSSQRSKASRGKKGSKKRGQQAIDSTRAREIQSALIREHYLQGEPTGKWDSTTQAAMERYQAEHGWQSKTTPDSRALIKLGLGPSDDHLLNPESAMTGRPAVADPKARVKQTPAASSLPQN